jgi:Flp pilus assembly protein TadD
VISSLAMLNISSAADDTTRDAPPTHLLLRPGIGQPAWALCYSAKMAKRRSQRPATSSAPVAVSGTEWLPTHGWRLAVIVLLGTLAYANSITLPFVFDDRATVLDNTSIRDWSSPRVFTPQREVPSAGRPLVNLSHAINFAVGRVEPRGYHIVNLLLHLLCGMVLYGCVARTMSLPSVPERLRLWSADIALGSAGLWLVHPLNSEVVDYVTQRSESMMALCYLGTVYASARALSSRRGATWRGIGIVTCAAGMLCKESMVTAPVAVWLYDAVFVFGSAGIAVRRRWGYYLGLTATWLLLALVIWDGPRMHSAGFGTKISPWTYLLNQAVMITQYLKLAVWPAGLVVAYGPPQPLGIDAVWPHAAVVALLAVATLVALWRMPLVGFAGAWLFVTLAPTSSIVPIATEVGAERRMYLPLAVLVSLAVSFVALAATRVTASRARHAFAIVCVASAVLLTAATITRNREYASPLGLARTVLARWPTPFAHAIVGTQLAVAGQHADAIAELRIAAPGYTLARYHLGGELFNQGTFDEAVVQLRRFVAAEPLLAEAVPARLMIGRAEMLRSDFPAAIEELREVLKMAPRGAESHTTASGFLADSLFHQQEFQQAIAEYQVYLVARPQDVGAWINLGVALAQTADPREAGNAFKQALRLDPSNATARRNLAILAEDAPDVR